MSAKYRDFRAKTIAQIDKELEQDYVYSKKRKLVGFVVISNSLKNLYLIKPVFMCSCKRNLDLVGF